MKILKQIIQLLTCCLLLIAIAINKNQRIGGVALTQTSDAEIEVSHDEWNTNNGFRVISTKNIAKDIWGREQLCRQVPLLPLYKKQCNMQKTELPQIKTPISNGMTYVFGVYWLSY